MSTGTTSRRFSVNGVSLHAEIGGSGFPLVLLHGFTGSAESWRSVSAAFRSVRQTIAVDLIGHGLSDAPAAVERYRMERCVEDLLALFDALGAERVDLLGYSMGGRTALQVAVAAPRRVRSLVLESATAGIEDEAERRARVESDEALARSLERDGLATFVERWENLPLFASQQRLPAGVRERERVERLRNDPRGLANSLRGMGTGGQASLWSRLGELAVPTLLIAGELDAKFCALAREMHGRLPRSTLRIVPDAGHNVHLEQPDAFAAAVLEFLSRQA